MKLFPLIACAASLCWLPAHAQLRLPAVLSSGMVLQQKDSVQLWGWANASQQVHVRCSWNDRIDSVQTSNGAMWKMKVRTPAAGGPFTITISADTTIVLSDVLIGEVWVCSGQSNMAMSNSWGEKDVAAELANPSNAAIRLFNIPATTADFPQDNVTAHWTACDSGDLKKFSSVGYFFGRKINSALKVPVGLINASWGGTPAETWTPAEKIKADTVLFSAASQLKTYPWWPSKPGAAFNGMLAPLVNFNIAGWIWYQGEANTAASRSYTKLLTSMIDAWRASWQKELPFYYVQIAPYTYQDSLEGAKLQEAQTAAMAHSRVGMVVITDLIDSATNIHPSHKKEVGNRLASWALAETYGLTGISYRSPIFDSLQKKGSKFLLSFRNASSGLVSTDKIVKGFYLSDANSKWFPAAATIQKDRIIVSSKQVSDPVFVRYGFSNTMTGNVSSKEGLPLTPFRTDSF